MKSPVAIVGINSFSGGTFARHVIEAGGSVVGFARSENTKSPFVPFFSHLQSNPSKLKVHIANLIHNSRFIADTIVSNNCTHVVNFAAQSMVAESWETPEDWYDTNVSAFAKFTNFLHNNGKSKIQKFVQFSTPEVYGSTSGLIRENWQFNPTTPYAISRAASDLHLRAMFNTFGFPVIFTRTANIYGQYQKLYRLIPKLIVKAIKKEKFQLHGGGSSLRSFIHSSDVATALSLILESGEIGGTYHISGQEFVSILDLTNKILGNLDTNFEEVVSVVGDRPGKDQAYLLDSSKIREELGWNNQISLDEGLNEVVSWIKAEWNTIGNLSLEYTHSR